MASELKPCICGKTPRLDIKKGLAGITKVPFYREQIMCRCGVSSKIFKAPRKAVEAWNTRHGTLTNEGTTIPTPVAPVSPDATGKCEELVTVGYAPSEYDMGLDYQQLGISRLYPKSCASGAVAVVTRSQAEELLAATDKTIALAETTMIEMHQDLNKLEADNAAKDAQIKELEQINAVLMGDDEDKPRYTTKRLKHEITRATEALETKLAAAEQQLQGIVTAWESLPGGRNYSTGEVQDWILGPMQKAINRIRAVLGGKPS